MLELVSSERIIKYKLLSSEITAQGGLGLYKKFQSINQSIIPPFTGDTDRYIH